MIDEHAARSRGWTNLLRAERTRRENARRAESGAPPSPVLTRALERLQVGEVVDMQSGNLLLARAVAHRVAKVLRRSHTVECVAGRVMVRRVR